MLRARDLRADERPPEPPVEVGAARLAAAAPVADPDRLRMLLDQHFREVWRVLRRLGVPLATVDDSAQQVFIIAARKLALVRPGSERAFLTSTAVRVAANARRAAVRRELADASV